MANAIRRIGTASVVSAGYKQSKIQSMADKIVNMQASTPVEKEKDFQQVHDIVVFHHSEVARKVNTEMLQMAWEIGQYISTCIKSAGWGS